MWHYTKEMDEKQRQIIESAYNVIAEYGIKKISMEELCRRMGISKKTLYKYVDNKAHLLSQLSEFVHDQVKTRMKELEDKGMNAIDFLLEMSKIACATHVHINPSMIYEFRTYYPQEYEHYMNLKKEMVINAIIKNLENGIREGLYREDINLGIMAHLYFQKVEDFHLLSQEESAGFSFPEVFEVMFENHIRGISNPRGIAYFEKQKEKLKFTV
jgi:TetR/AcrR family transcriptional regulator, cholesterol catabolism regulator